MTLHVKMAMPDSQRYPKRRCLIKYELDMTRLFLCGFSAKVICAFLAYKKQWRNYHNKTLFEPGIDGIFHIFIRRFQGYRCKSGITILAWRVTWFYAYSPFKSIFHAFSVVIKQVVLTVAWKLIERSAYAYCCVYVHWTLYMYTF